MRCTFKKGGERQELQIGLVRCTATVIVLKNDVAKTVRCSAPYLSVTKKLQKTTKVQRTDTICKARLSM